MRRARGIILGRRGWEKRQQLGRGHRQEPPAKAGNGTGQPAVDQVNLATDIFPVFSGIVRQQPTEINRQDRPWALDARWALAQLIAGFGIEGEGSPQRIIRPALLERTARLLHSHIQRFSLEKCPIKGHGKLLRCTVVDRPVRAQETACPAHEKGVGETMQRGLFQCGGCRGVHRIEWLPRGPCGLTAIEKDKRLSRQALL